MNDRVPLPPSRGRVDLFDVGLECPLLGKELPTHRALERLFLAVRCEMYDPLGGCPEGLLTEGALEWLGASVDPLMNTPLAGLSEGAGAESALERLLIGVDQTVPVEGALAAQHLPAHATLEGALLQMFLGLDFKSCDPCRRLLGIVCAAL